MPRVEIERRVPVTCPHCGCLFYVVCTWLIGKVRVDCADCRKTIEFDSSTPTREEAAAAMKA
jgi:hypothetical protein